MTIEGAIADLQNLIDSEGIPFWAKPSLQKVKETVEMERVIDIPESKYLSLKKCFENDVPLGKTDTTILKSIPLNDVLDKIKAEIEQLPTKTRINWNGCCPDIDYPEIEYVDVTKNELLEIIDKYKAEMEGEEK